MAVDIDAGLRVGGQHVGPKRSPLYDTAASSSWSGRSSTGPGFHLAGVMTYEGQIAGVPDIVPTQKARSLIVRRLKTASVSQLEVRRREIADALAEVAELEFWNAGGSGLGGHHHPGPGRHRDRRRLRAAGARPVRPLRVVRAASGGVLRRSASPAARPTRW